MLDEPHRGSNDMPLEESLAARLADLESHGLARRVPATSDRRGPQYVLRGREVLGFCSNDYLGFAAETTTVTSHCGASGSRLISGDLPSHRDVETLLAAWVGREDAVLFPSGFQLNVSALPCLLEPTDVVFSDALNHASLIDGLRLAKAPVIRLPHGTAPVDIPDATRHAWWVCESLYSMDGDYVDPDRLRDFVRTGNYVYVDDAHALGLFSQATGWMGHCNVVPTVLVGTLGKALGASGGFLAASKTVCQWVRTRARGFIYSTGPSPLVSAAILQLLPRLCGPEGDERRARLWSNIARFDRNLSIERQRPSPIYPFIVGSNENALRHADQLFEDGFHIQAIRPPTVPENTSRLRLTLSALHKPDQIDRLCEALHRRFRADGLHIAECMPR